MTGVSLVGAVLTALVGFCLYFLIGEELERRSWLELPSTLSLYTTSKVCKVGDSILHCGDCGACSNRHDIRIYNQTAQTLTNTMTRCALLGVFWGGESQTLQCLMQHSDLTEPCARCWVGNSECNKKHCHRTCFHHKVLTFLPTFQSWGDPLLDPCIACDEKFCGPGFVACSGANRRRVGVVSDLQRDMNLEMCNKTDWQYIMNGGGGDDEVAGNTEHGDGEASKAGDLWP